MASGSTGRKASHRGPWSRPQLRPLRFARRALESRSGIPISNMHRDGAKCPTNLPASARWFSEWRMWPTGNERGFLMTPRRNFLIGISAAAVSAPPIVRVGSLMTLRGIVMPVHKSYPSHYGFCDRLWINWRYKDGELRGPALLRMIEEGILQVPPAILAYDLARWGTGELSLAAREQRRQALWPRVRDIHHLIGARTV
jgi:hypothetical protein